MNAPCFSQSCARISAELIAVEIERWQDRLADAEYRAFLAGLFRMALDEPRSDDANPARWQAALSGILARHRK